MLRPTRLMGRVSLGTQPAHDLAQILPTPNLSWMRQVASGVRFCSEVRTDSPGPKSRLQLGTFPASLAAPLACDKLCDMELSRHANETVVPGCVEPSRQRAYEKT